MSPVLLPPGRHILYPYQDGNSSNLERLEGPRMGSRLGFSTSGPRAESSSPPTSPNFSQLVPTSYLLRVYPGIPRPVRSLLLGLVCSCPCCVLLHWSGHPCLPLREALQSFLDPPGVVWLLPAGHVQRCLPYLHASVSTHGDPPKEGPRIYLCSLGLGS